MHFYNVIKRLAEQKDIVLFVDMDGVIAEYNITNNLYNFLNKRPLKQNIENIKEVTSIENVEMHILSVCREDSQIEDKNIWLDNNAPFFEKDQRIIISRESKDWKTAKEIKIEFLTNYQTDKQIVFLDDDNDILRELYNNYDNIIVIQDSELVD